jgi:hypothetical protein
MKLDFIGQENNFVRLDLTPEKDRDRHFCAGTPKAFKAGDLHISIGQPYLVIEYDGIKSSFKVKKKEREILKRALESFWRGELEFRVGCFSIWNDKLKESYCDGCNIRFVKPKFPKNNGTGLQRRLIESYIPPPPNNGEIKIKNKKNSIFIQKKLIDDGFFVSKRPLFKPVKSFTKQKVLL